jgi:hypothetical protein
LSSTQRLAIKISIPKNHSDTDIPTFSKEMHVQPTGYRILLVDDDTANRIPRPGCDTADTAITFAGHPRKHSALI